MDGKNLNIREALFVIMLQKHLSFDYPKIVGEDIVFNVADCSDKVEEEKRKLRPLTLEGVTDEEFQWLDSTAKNTVTINCGYQGTSYQGYDLIHNTQTRQVALKWQGRLMVEPVETLTLWFYDGLTDEVNRLSFVLEEHRKGKVSGWGDQQIPDQYMPAST